MKKYIFYAESLSRFSFIVKNREVFECDMPLNLAQKQPKHCRAQNREHIFENWL